MTRLAITRNRTLKAAVLVIAGLALPVIAWAQWNTSGNDIYNSNTGKIGIGTTSPQTPVHIYNNSTYGALILESGTSASYAPRLYFQDDRSGGRTWSIDSGAYAGQLNVVDNTAGELRMTIDASGNVGIGTASPTNPLHMSSASTSNAPHLLLSNTSGSNTNTFGPGLILANGVGGAHGYILEQRQSAASYLAIANISSPYTEYFAVDQSGNVGIGTSIPSSRLEVAGDVTVSGNISAKYQDIAEWVPARNPIAPGSVVILDPSVTNSVIPSLQSYDERVAGVISSNPGLVLGVAGKTKVRVATTGRVKVRVDTTRSPIHIGDLLVTSDKEGFAMKSEPIEMTGAKIHRPGTLIGKALEPLSQGEGEILVLLSLQ